MSKVTIYFKGGMKAVLDADKVVFVGDDITVQAIWELLAKGLRLVRWDSVNYAKMEVVEDNANE